MHFVRRVQFTTLSGAKFPPPSEPIAPTEHISVLCAPGGLHLLFGRNIQRGSTLNQVEKFVGVKYKKVEQALGLSLRNLFKQLAWRISPAEVLTN